MSLAAYLGLLGAWVLAITVPGPDTVQLIRLGARSRRSAVFAFVLLVATAFGRLGELQESGVSLHWPVAGVIALWALVLRDRAE